MELMEEKEDRITTLPDPIIHHILSFLPSTKEAIKTSVLSKRWHKQWIHIPALIFDFSGMISEDFSNTSTFIENTLTLHNCSKLDKFHLQFWCSDTNDPQFTSKILFAIRKNVEELFLCPIYMKYILPEFVFNHSSLVKLRADGCIFMPDGKFNLNWGCLTELNLDLCSVTDDVVEHILAGSPLLKSLEISDCYELDKIVIASKSLKRFVIQWPDPSCFRYTVSSIEISCPNLEELSIKDMSIDEPKLFDRMIENVLSGCLLLESFELSNCGNFEKLIVASKSLKRLVLRFVYFINFYVHGCTEKPVIEISCSRLEELKILENLNVEIFKALNLPSSLCATIDFDYDDEQYYETFTDYDVRETQKRLISILQQLKHVKELRIGGWIIQVLSDSVVEVGGLISPALNTKCLTLSYPYSNDHYTGLAFMLRNSPLLEKLVIDCPPHNQPCDDDLPKLKDFEENYWNSNSPAVDCLALHLKTIKITFIRKRCKLMLNLLQFLLKNARVLEKLVIVLNPRVLKKLDVILKDRGTCFLEEWLNLPRFSEKTIVELLSYN